MDDAAGVKAQLAPLEAALLEAAREDARARLAAAHDRADTLVREAESAARHLLARAVAEGEEAAARQGAYRRVEAEREARRQLLVARRTAYDALFTAALASFPGERSPESAALQERLERVARSVLGHDAIVQPDPEGLGGVRARLDGRRIDLTLPVLVRRCIERMGREVERLWS